MSKDSHISFLDGFRGLAILAVFLFHGLGVAFSFDELEWDGWFRDFDAPWAFLMLYPVSYGHAGVAFFFVVSGFCIHLSHQRSNNPTWIQFANRRFFRIYPPYFVAFVTFLLVWPWGNGRITTTEDWRQFAYHALAIHNFNHETYFGINKSLWSIAIESQLYLIYPLLLSCVARFGWRGTLLLTGILEVGLRFSGDSVPFWISHSPFAFWLSWSLGAYLCKCYMDRKYASIFRVRFDLCLLVALAIPLFRPSAPLTFLAFSFLAAIALERLLTGAWVLPRNRLFLKFWSHLRFLGIVSYSFYLIHQPLMGLTGKIVRTHFASSDIHPLVYYSLSLSWYPVILLLAYAGHRFIEQPSISLGKILLGGRKSSQMAKQL